jgi:hypothetical protein
MASVADASTVGDAAMALAASGYIITAFGGTGDNGFLLVGTRVQGDTTPRPPVVNPENIGEMLLEGYAVVGYVSNACILEE